MPDLLCKSCGGKLGADDVGATKKLMDRGAKEFLCIPCLAKRFGVGEERLREKIEEWRAYGCGLFPQKS